MDDETLGGKIVPTNLSIGYSRADYATVGARARELLAKPVVTRDVGPIKEMSSTDIGLLMVDEVEREYAKGNCNGYDTRVIEYCARVAHRLATTPAPEVDADAGAKALAWEFHKAALVEIGAKNADDLWASFKDHQRLGWRAVAAMEKGNG